MIRLNAICLILIINFACGMSRSLNTDMKTESSSKKAVESVEKNGDEILLEDDDDPALNALINLVFEKVPTLSSDKEQKPLSNQNVDPIEKNPDDLPPDDKAAVRHGFVEGPTPASVTDESTTPSDFRLGTSCLKACAG